MDTEIIYHPAFVMLFGVGMFALWFVSGSFGLPGYGFFEKIFYSLAYYCITYYWVSKWA